MTGMHPEWALGLPDWNGSPTWDPVSVFMPIFEISASSNHHETKLKL